MIFSQIAPITALSELPPEWVQTVLQVLQAALEAVEPAAAVKRFMQLKENGLRVSEAEIPLSSNGRVFLIGAGKAGAPMAAAAARILVERLTAGCVIVKEGHATISEPEWTPALERVEVLEAGHPVPDERGVSGAKRLQALLQDLTPDDLVICLISGGGSALLVSPVADVSLQDLQSLTTSLLNCGAAIEEINALRKHLDLLKGGGLARSVFPARLVTLILSDVIGDPLDVIASGPTVPDRSTFEEVGYILERYSLWGKLPSSILSHFQKGLQGMVPETPKPGDPIFNKVTNVLIGSNRLAAQAAFAQAQSIGLNPLLLTTFLQGEARQVGRTLAAVARQLETSDHPVPRPGCVIAGGETTVTLTDKGKGGRNQEAALAAVAELSGLPHTVLITLATDGGDGPTDAAGAVVTGRTLERAHQQSLDPTLFLAHHDSYPFFQSLGDLLITGPTQTNVNDLSFLFVF